jgi:hypothetical protein
MPDSASSKLSHNSEQLVRKRPNWRSTGTSSSSSAVVQKGTLDGTVTIANKDTRTSCTTSLESVITVYRAVHDASPTLTCPRRMPR